MHAWRRGFACKGTSNIAGLFVRGLRFSGKLAAKKRHCDAIGFVREEEDRIYFSKKGGKQGAVFQNKT